MILCKIKNGRFIDSVFEHEKEKIMSSDVAEITGDVAEFQGVASEAKNIPISLIRPAEIALRGVNKETIEFQTLLKSVKAKGVLNSILVREQKDAVTGAMFYALIDGLQRFTCAHDCGQLTIPANIVSMDDGEALEAQIITNVNRVPTKHAEYAKALLRILHRNPMMTQNQLAEKLCQSITWLNDRLSLTDLAPSIQQLVDTNQICLSNAYSLAKLPHDEQVKEVDAAMTENPNTFIVRMKERLKAIREAKKTGKDVGEAQFVPVAHVQKIADLKSELENANYRTALLAKAGLTGSDAQKAWELCLKWALHMDEDSIAEQRRAYDARLLKREEEKKKREAARAEKLANEAASRQLDLSKGF